MPELRAHGPQFLNRTLTYRATSSVRALLEGSREEQILIPESTWKEIKFPKQTEDSMPLKKKKKSQLFQGLGIKIKAQVLLYCGGKQF